MTTMDKLHIVLAYSKYLLNKKKCSDLYSPLLNDLFTKVIKNNDGIEGAEKIEEARNYLLKKKSWIDVYDMGTGKNRPRLRRLKDIAKLSVSPEKKAKLLYNLVKFQNPENIIELGTSFGISTMYMALAKPDTKVYTVEGCCQTFAIAQENFNKLGFNNIMPSNASFDAVFKKILEDIGKADFIYFDGNHEKKATLRYFETALDYAHEKSIFIFDDINQSFEMGKAWKKITKNKKVTCSVNLFQLGLVFFNPNINNQNIVL